MRASLLSLLLFALAGCVRAGFAPHQPDDGRSPDLSNDAHDAGAPDTAAGDAAPGDTIFPFTLTLSPASWSTTVRGQRAFQATATYPEGGSADYTEQVSWSSSDSAILLADDTPGNKGHAAAVGVGAATLTVTHAPTQVSASLAVTVAPATMLVQWGGYNAGGHGAYAPQSGKLLKTVSLDAKARDYRGLLCLPGGFITVGTNPYLQVDFAEYLQNDGSTSSAPLLLTGGPPGGGHQAVTRTRDGVYIVVPQYFANAVYVYSATGAYLSSFGKGNLSQPFRAVELDDGRMVVSSFADGRLVAFPRTTTGFGAGSTLASGFDNPLGIDYCRATKTILVSDYGAKKVLACTTAGACKVLANHQLPQPRALQLDLNSTDTTGCAFFLGYREGGANRIARFFGDGTIDAMVFATMPAGVVHIFSIDFLVPKVGS